MADIGPASHEIDLAIRRTFGPGPRFGDEKPTSLGVFVGFASEGASQERLFSAVQGRGKAAAQELLAHLKALPKQAKLEPAEFVLGYVPLSDAGKEALEEWDRLLGEAFALMAMEERSPQATVEFGQRIIALIRETATFTAPRLQAWKELT